MKFSEIEAALDHVYLDHPLPHSNRILAIWYCVTASEDSQRVMFTELGDDLSAARLLFYIDRFKYSMRFALDRIAKECRDTTWAPVPRLVNPRLYGEAAKLMYAGVDFALASQVCSALHSGTATVEEQSDYFQLNSDELRHDKAYAALELLGTSKPDEMDNSMLMFSWIRDSRNVPEVVKAIAVSVSVCKRKVEYTYNDELGELLQGVIAVAPRLIPPGWVFPWGGLEQTRALLGALSLRCAYHLVAVHFGAAVMRLRGGGESSIALILTKQELVDHLRRRTSLDVCAVEAFIEALTWGRGTTTPDPALQPLIPLGFGRLLLPCLHLLSSHQERNALSLMARLSPRDFDRQSHLFETQMVAGLAKCVRPSSVLLRKNIRVRTREGEEELDLVLVEEATNTLLVIELRWMLGPGDPREVQNRKKVCLEKVTQIARKTEWVRRQTQDVVASMFGKELPAATSAWKVFGLVLVDGFGGTRSPDPSYLIMPSRLFEKALSRGSSLRSIVQWCSDAGWLPQEGRHFSVISFDIPLKGMKPLRVEGMDSPDVVLSFSEDVLASLT